MRWINCLLLTSAVCASSCGRKPDREPARPDAGAPAATAEKGEAQGQRGVGDDIRDFADYATGKGPIQHGKQINRRFRKIQAEHNRKLEEAMEK